MTNLKTTFPLWNIKRESLSLMVYALNVVLCPLMAVAVLIHLGAQVKSAVTAITRHFALAGIGH
jgi:hypothetical protein